MNTNDLRIFEAVALHSSFTRAAEAMFTVQSNVTARIRSLEEEFGTSLFERNAKKVALTPAGEVLMQYAKEITHLLDEAKREVKNIDVLTGSLKIGCIETTMALRVPTILHDFGAAYPHVELEFKSAMRPELVQDVLDYKLDAAFVSGPISISGLTQEIIHEEQLVILAHRKAASLSSELSRHAIPKIVVFDQGCVFRERLESLLSAKGIVQYRPIVVNSIEGIINFVEAGLGISILPEQIVSSYYAAREIKTFPLSKSLGTMTTVLISRSNRRSSKLMQVFIDMYKNQSKHSNVEQSI
ncbi:MULTISPECIES: LysR family transcriptional regulator [Olivibacter]|jgi:DNA-binding transcriptional LysR family regulator|uniref:LysR family transcriptional regulator n=1 Tax=Olivibacter oleidegradans TaxID=760123 RepID=A0ABV6HMM9_9SPHI|nr:MULTISPECIES: LysR family transcriptional regulator [Olivibacter]MDM8173072.1 LysR family transcriptional regulator [Olivibacter sp. 47]QEL02857.1 LysR family transcriptional regulator [Olivibacter sp. LS-1]